MRCLLSFVGQIDRVLSGQSSTSGTAVATATLGPPGFEPVEYHADLRKCEREKDAHGIEWNQTAGVSAERCDQNGREDGQDNDAVRENQLVATGAKLARHKSIAGEQTRKALEVGERGISCGDRR